MRTLQGITIQPGLRIGFARKVRPPQWVIARPLIPRQEIEAELALLNEALAAVERDIDSHLQAWKGSEADKEILASHLFIVRDPELLAQLREAVDSRLASAAAAVQTTFSQISSQFKSLPNDFFAQRAADYRDVEQRLMSAVTGQQPASLAEWREDQIAVLSEVTPSQISLFARHQVGAWCSEHGSFTSHASILTRSLRITAVTGLPGLTGLVEDGDELILDGLEGRVIIAPDEATKLMYRQLLEKYREQEQQLRQSAGLPAQTLDGRSIKLRCNLDLLSELGQPVRLGASGIGLYRTEFLYLGKDELPSEDLQFDVYREVAEKVSPHSVIIRSFDLGGDKLSHLIPSEPEENPYLGLRGVRFSLSRPEIFKAQIRAVLRASHYGRVQLMFPMVADLRDFLRARQLVEACKQELGAQGIPFDRALPLGVMVEIPSAALCAAELARHCDFLSIGTNDLVQYTLAADRNNSALNEYYTTHHPSVLALLKLTLEAGRSQGKPVSVCGEMASLPEYVPLLVGLGFTELSVGINAFERCKSIIRRCDARLLELVQTEDLTALGEIENLVFDLLKPYYSL